MTFKYLDVGHIHRSEGYNKDYSWNKIENKKNVRKVSSLKRSAKWADLWLDWLLKKNSYYSYNIKNETGDIANNLQKLKDYTGEVLSVACDNLNDLDQMGKLMDTRKTKTD